MILINKTIYFIAQKLRQLGYNFNENADERVLSMKKEINRLVKIEFLIEQYPDGSWTAESTNIEGIITGAKSTKEMTSNIKDAIFTYFGIPPHLCNDSLLRGDNEPVTIKQRIYV